MEIKILKENIHTNGRLYSFQINDRLIDVLFLFHAIARAQKWQLSTEQIAETLFFPNEVLAGHFGRFIAHRIYGEHVLRAIYEYDNNFPVLVSVYFPYAKRYFQGGLIYEDKILN